MSNRVSVCMAVKNGSRFIKSQMESILLQLTENDEVIVSDDHSNDDTLLILKEFQDDRIKVFTNPSHGIVSNFQNSLVHATRSYIFLADQDDIWDSHKIQIMLHHLQENDLVVCDCRVADENLNLIHESFFSLNKSKRGIIKNLYKNSYMGCCMAFNRRVIEKVLPFPIEIPMHDLWIGIKAELHFKVKFIADKLVTHRRHERNASSTSSNSPFRLQKKLTHRVAILKSLLHA